MENVHLFLAFDRNMFHEVQTENLFYAAFTQQICSLIWIWRHISVPNVTTFI